MNTSFPKSDPSQMPWGVYSPKWKNRLLRVLVRFGFGHGVIKKLLQRLWDTNDCNTVDINYHNILLRCTVGTNNIEGRLLFSSKLREKEELAFLKQYLDRGGTFIDIGANIGYYSLMAVQMGAKQVVSFEPNAIVRNRFEFNRSANGFEQLINIIPHPLGMERCESTLHFSESDLGSGSLIEAENSTHSMIVQVHRIDDVLNELNITHIDALKIDVEGYEYEALYPLFECPSLLPECMIIEHAHSHLWKEDVVKLLIDLGCDVVGKNRSNIFLKKRI